IIKKDPRIADYVLSLTIVGTLISIYQNLLYYKILPESISPCSAGVSCTTKYVEYFGFLTIPLLSLITLITITVLMIMYKKQNHA
ncbi:MAG: disulfide bond formation protein B, partial [Candidatus Pacebacteria bacterium]|nr:disulfide bond formation protein B [Candidatus Paceibacterota bacterium]